MNNILVRQELEKILTNKTLTIIGDSILLQLFQGMVELVRPKGAMQYSNRKKFTCMGDLHKRVKGGETVTAAINHGYNGYIKFIAVYTIMGSNPTCFLCTTVDKIYSLVKDDDIILVNIGIHYDRSRLTVMARTIRYLSQNLKRLTASRRVQIVYKLTVPQHFITASGAGWYNERTSNKRCVRVPKPDRYPSDHVMKYYANRYGFKVLDDFDIFVNRSDLHQDMSDYTDCSHYCFTVETIMPQIALLTQLLL